MERPVNTAYQLLIKMRTMLIGNMYLYIGNRHIYLYQSNVSFPRMVSGKNFNSIRVRLIALARECYFYPTA